MASKEQVAKLLVTIADTLLEIPSRAAGLPPEAVQSFVQGTSVGAVDAARSRKSKKTTAYQRAYKRSFKRVAPKYKKRNGEWKKGGFKAAVRQAHKEAKK